MEGRWLSGWLQGAKSLRRRERAEASVGADVESGPDSVAPSVNVKVPKGYSPKNVGNDASARPWESLGDTHSDVRPEEHPREFDAEGFLRASKSHFLSLQEAWDRGDIHCLRSMMTEGMLAQVQAQLSEREKAGVGQHRTEVVMLEARLLGVEEVGDDFLANVEFSGLIREDPSAGPNPFRELWNVTRPKGSNSGWLVAGVQALQ